MQLEIISPESIVFTGEASSVILPGKNGYFEILNNHAPLIALLKKGNLKFRGVDQDGEQISKMENTITKSEYQWLANQIKISSENISNQKHFVFEIEINQGFVEVNNNKVTVLI